MWVPRPYRNENREELLELIAAYPFGTLVSDSPDGPFATHLPLLVEPGPTALGSIVGHMARANPHWKSWGDRTRVLVMFHGPHAYISPTWYLNQATVPTWNYAVVHAYGTPRVIHNPPVLRPMVERLLRVFEGDRGAEGILERHAQVVDAELGGIVGFEIPIERLEGKYKLNQNRSRADREGVIRALEAADDPMSREVARLMRRSLESGERNQPIAEGTHGDGRTQAKALHPDPARHDPEGA